MAQWIRREVYKNTRQRLRISRFRVKLIFFCPPCDAFRKTEFRSLAPHAYLVPYERRARPRGTATSAPGRRGATRYMLRSCGGATGLLRRCCGLASSDARSSPPSKHHNYLVFFVSEDVFVSLDAAAAPEETPRRRSCNRPTPLRKHATLTNHNDNICTPVYASNVNTFPISNAHAAASATATNPPVASRSLGTAGAAPPQPADCIARAARDIVLVWRVDGVLRLLLPESLSCTCGLRSDSRRRGVSVAQ